MKMTRLSCHRFRSNQVRLGLSVLAYNLGNLWRRRGIAEAHRQLAADESAATSGQEGWAAGETCSLLLGFSGGGTSEPAAVRRHAGPDRAATVTDGIESWWPRRQGNLSIAGSGEERYRKNGGGNWGTPPGGGRGWRGVLVAGLTR